MEYPTSLQFNMAQLPSNELGDLSNNMFGGITNSLSDYNDSTKFNRSNVMGSNSLPRSNNSNLMKSNDSLGNNNSLGNEGDLIEASSSNSTEGNNLLARNNHNPDTSQKSKTNNDYFSHTLIKYGFVPISKIHTIRDDNIVEAAYIKVISKDGYTAYVQLDVEGETSINEIDSIVIETDSSSNIDFSTKKNMYECARHKACGVLFICKNGICTLTGQGNPEPKESVYVIDKNDDSSLFFTQYPVPFPIVLMSSIPIHHDTIHYDIRDVNDKLTTSAITHCGNKLGEFDQNIMNLHSIFSQYCILQKDKSAALNSSIIKLQKAHDNNLGLLAQYKLHPHDEKLRNIVKSDSFQVNFKLIYSNLVDKRQKLSDLIRICQTITDRSSQISDNTLHIKDLGNHVNNVYANIAELKNINDQSTSGRVADIEWQMLISQ